jgi:putative heme-binding domain-containing protein
MVPMRYVPVAALFFMVSAGHAAAVQRPADVEHGKKLFEGMCARCHGIDGTGDEGPGLNRPTLSQAPDDEALRTVIRDGIPDRGMPRVRRLTENELNQLVAYVRSLGRTASAATSGNVERGRELYGKLGCATCHIVDGQGGSFGPELTGIGVHRGAAYLRQALIAPEKVLPKGVLPIPGRGFNEYLPVRVVTADGREVRGVRVNEDPFTIQLKDPNNRYHSFRKSDLKQIDKEFGKSLMPGYSNRLTASDTSDLVAYLSNLRGAK